MRVNKYCLSFQFFTCMHLRDKIKHTATKDDTLLGMKIDNGYFSLQIGCSSPSQKKEKEKKKLVK